ncbi:MAG: hypothetical protein K9I85_02795 [Saprospiraceae bacterium]|nr:hypothetical protein [Saprospiraceae bacterium]
MRLWTGWLLIFVMSSLMAMGQEVSPPDSLAAVKPSRKVFTPSPQRAALYGLIPGGGQVYNRRYWKLPIVYGAMGGLFYLSQFNQKEYKRFKTAYQKELLGEVHEFSGLNLPATVLRNQRDYYRKSMEEYYIFMSLTYLLSIAEAYVDAHLRNFDINEDLSGQIHPTWMVSNTSVMPGISLTVKWRSDRTRVTSLTILP